MSKNDDMLAAEYALGLLEQEDRVAFERRLNSEPQLTDKLHFWQSHLSGLDNEFAEVDHGGDVWAKIEKELGQSDGVAGPVSRAENDNDAAKKWRVATLLTGAVASVLAIILLFQTPETSRDGVGEQDRAALVAQLQGDIDGLLLTASYSPDDGEMKVDVEGMPETETEPEIWVQKTDKSVVSLGQVGRDGISRMTVPEDIRQFLDDGALLILTMEPPSETPHSEPSGDAVAAGKAALIT